MAGPAGAIPSVSVIENCVPAAPSPGLTLMVGPPTVSSPPSAPSTPPPEPFAVTVATTPFATPLFAWNSMVAVLGVTPTTVAVKPVTFVETEAMVVASPLLK